MSQFQFHRPTISLEESADESGKAVIRAIWNVPRSDRCPNGTRIFSKWYSTPERSLRALTRELAEHPGCALALNDLIVTGVYHG